jgi:hypothetical protein
VILVAEVSLVLAVTPVSMAEGATCSSTFEPVRTPRLQNLENNRLRGVAVMSPTSAWAVGDHGSQTGLLERFDGAGWTAIRGPGTPPINELFDVTALSSTDAFAVGERHGVHTHRDSYQFIERWNGKKWSEQYTSFSNGGRGSLLGVAGTGPSHAWAVGYWRRRGSNRRHPSIRRWDSSTWTDSPAASTARRGTLRAVAALTSADAWAVGSAPTGALIEHWNGSSWKQFADPGGSATDQLADVLALSAGNVWAVGSTDQPRQTLIEHWNGRRWSVVTSPDPGNWSDVLASVSGVSKTDLFAVGTKVADGTARALALRWDGKRWSTVSAPLGGSARLEGVDVPATGPAFAVGSRIDPYTGDVRTLVAEWTSSGWSARQSDNLDTYASGYVTDFTAVSDTDVWALAHGRFEPISLHWDGSRWTPIVFADIGHIIGLTAISAAAASDVWAVGWGYGGARIDHWDGASWSVVPVEAGPREALTGVSADAANDAWAVGSAGNGGRILHWDGLSWAPVAARADTTFEDVLAISPTDVWVIGFDAADAPVALHWDGAAWKNTPVPGPSTGFRLRRIGLVPGGVGLWVVGNTYDSAAGRYVGWTARWNGSTWHLISGAPIGATEETYFTDVTALSPTDAYLVGDDIDPGYSGMVQHWDGKAWTSVAAPPAIEGLAITALPDGHGWLGLLGDHPIAAACGL